MKQQKSAYRVRLAMEYLVNGIASGRFPAGSVLPPLRRLALMAGVSYVTMWKTVEALGKKGILLVAPHEPARVALRPTDPTPPVGAPAAESAHDARRRGWRRIKDEIERDVLHGTFDTGMPSVKQFEGRYHTTHRTLAKALDSLRSEGVLRAKGRGYEIAPVSHGRPKSTICFLIEKEYLDHCALGLHMGHDYLHAIQLCGSQLGVEVIIAECTYQGNQLLPSRLKALIDPASEAGHTILGYIYRMNDFASSVRLLKLLQQQGKPVSILDDGGDWSSGEVSNADALFAVFPVGTTPLPGREAGRYLLNRGHRNVAYFSLYDGLWSNARLLGLQEVYRKAGYSKAIKQFISLDPWPLVESEFRLEPSVIGGKAPVHKPPDDISGQLGAHQSLNLLNHMKTEHLHRHLYSLLDQAVFDTTITAWVFVNDLLATAACEYLRDKNIPHSSRPAILSFDDTLTAAVNGITSYSFNIPAIVNATFRHILDYSAQPGQIGPRVIEIGGAFVERESAARAYAVR